MLEYDGTDVSKGVHVNQTDGCLSVLFAITSTFLV